MKFCFNILLTKGLVLGFTDDFIVQSYEVYQGNFCEKFQEWEKFIPFIKTEMNVSDMDKLIDTELYANVWSRIGSL